MAKKVKQKTHKGAAKRFKITATGKVMHRSQNFRHNISKKSKKQVRRLKTLKEIAHKAKHSIHRLLGIK